MEEGDFAEREEQSHQEEEPQDSHDNPYGSNGSGNELWKEF